MPHDNSVGSIDEVANRLQCVVVPGLADLLELAHDRVPTHEWALFRPTLGGPHDGVWVVQLTKRVHVARVPRIEGCSCNLHVLLRHRYSRSPTASRASASV